MLSNMESCILDLCIYGYKTGFIQNEYMIIQDHLEKNDCGGFPVISGNSEDYRKKWTLQ